MLEAYATLSGYGLCAEEYTADTLDRIWAEVQELQARHRRRKLTREDIFKALEATEAHPYGQIVVDTHSEGLKVPKRGEKTVLRISWFSWRHKKYIKWVCCRCKTKLSDNRKATEIIEDSSKYSAWEQVFLERAIAYRLITTKRRLIRKGYVLPPDIQSIDVYDEKYGMVLINCRYNNDRNDNYLCSPIGYVKVNFYIWRVDYAAKSIGIKLPVDAETWEDIEPQWIMAQLQKL